MINSNAIVSTIDSTTFHIALAKKLGNKHPPLVAMIEVTRRCPLTCAHCYNNLPMGDLVARRSELSYEEHCNLIDQLVDLGCFEFGFGLGREV